MSLPSSISNLNKSDNRYFNIQAEVRDAINLNSSTINEILPKTPDSTIVVKSASDFDNPDSSKVYLIDGVIDMGSTSIEIPAGGLNIIGYTFDVSQLISSEDNYTMFTSPVSGSGNILITDCGIEVSGTNSSVFAISDATGNNACEFNRVNFNNCTSLGYFEDYRQGLEFGTGRFGGTPELELRGTWSGGYRVSTSIARSLSNFTSLFKAGSGFTIGSRFTLEINCDLPATGSLINFSDSNIINKESLEIKGCRLTRQGVIDSDSLTISPNITDINVKSLWSDNVGVTNTIKYIKSSITTEVETNVAATDTYYPLLGTFTVNSESHMDMPTNGEFRLLSGNGSYSISGDLSITSTANNVLDIRVTKSSDDGSTWPDELFHIRRQVNNFAGSRDVAFFPISFISSLSEGDRVRLEVENKTGSNNTTAELDSYFIVAAV